jgi:hypothetical protein
MKQLELKQGMKYGDINLFDNYRLPVSCRLNLSINSADLPTAHTCGGVTARSNKRQLSDKMKTPREMAELCTARKL